MRGRIPARLTRDDEVYRYVAGYIAQHGTSPTQPQIRRATYYSAGGVHGRLLALERAGLIRRVPTEHTYPKRVYIEVIG